MSLRELLNALRETYCGTLGAGTCTPLTRRKSAGGSKLESIRFSKPNFGADRKAPFWIA